MIISNYFIKMNTNQTIILTFDDKTKYHKL